jgi:hypothetical protein
MWRRAPALFQMCFTLLTSATSLSRRSFSRTAGSSPNTITRASRDWCVCFKMNLILASSLPDDIRAAAAAGGFLPLVVLPPSEVPADSKKRRDLVGADAPKKKSKKTASPARPAKTRGDDTAVLLLLLWRALLRRMRTLRLRRRRRRSIRLWASLLRGSAISTISTKICASLSSMSIALVACRRRSSPKDSRLLSDAVAVLQKKYDRKRLEAISSDFYSAIPHNTGAKRPPLIDSMSLIEAKSALLRNLQHITFASELHGGKASAVVGPDRLYAAMHVELAPIVLLTSPTHTKEFERIERTSIRRAIRRIRASRSRVCLPCIAPPRRVSCRARATTTILASAR